MTRPIFRWMPGVRTGEGNREGVAFALRLALSFAVALLLVGFAGYVFMNRQLQASQVGQFAAAQRTD
ncbi:MAG: hypothetical protein QOK36_3619, partial [Gaiellales bacterium]|nr:hypothetical protein [Gaiellales bacterium]